MKTRRQNKLLYNKCVKEMNQQEEFIKKHIDSGKSQQESSTLNQYFLSFNKIREAFKSLYDEYIAEDLGIEDDTHEIIYASMQVSYWQARLANLKARATITIMQASPDLGE